MADTTPITPAEVRQKLLEVIGAKADILLKRNNPEQDDENINALANLYNAIKADLTDSTSEDTVSGGTSDESISGGSGTDTVTIVGGDDTVSGGSGSDTTVGGDDTVTGGSGTDTTVGG